MSRLTKKDETVLGGYSLVASALGSDIMAKALSKLGQYEDLEEKYEIDDFNDLDERLHAYKFLANHEYSCVDANAYNIMLKDLEEYREIEREIGVSWIDLFHALSKGCVYVKIPKYVLPQYSEDTIVALDIGVSCIWHFKKPQSFEIEIDGYSLVYYLNKYGVDWAFTEEELKGKSNG